MAEYTPEGFGDRLCAALERKQQTATWLHTEVEKGTNRATGSSWGSIHSYLHGKGPQDEPRPKIVEALAKALGVLPGHLLYNGPRTTEDSPLDRVALVEDRVAMQRLRRAVYEVVEKEIGPLMPAGVDADIIEMIMTGVSSIARAMQMAGDDYGTDDNARFRQAASSLGQALVAPLHALTLDPAAWSPPAKAQYVLQAIASLLVPLGIKYDSSVREWSRTREKASKRKGRRKRAA